MNFCSDSLDRPATPRRKSAGPFLQQVWRVTLLLLLLALSPGAVLAEEAPPSKEASGHQDQVVIALVNGQPIYKEQLLPKIKPYLERYQKLGATDSSAQELKLMWKKVLDEFIVGELLFQQGQKLTISDLKEKTEQQLAALKESRNPVIEGKNEEEMRQLAQRLVYISEYMARSDLVNPQVPEADVREFYEKHKQDFTAEESIHARHILITLAAEATAEEREKALEKINQARKMIQEGKPFAEVAQEYSAGPEASAGGDLGFVQRGYMPAEFDKLAFSLEKGSLSEVLQTPLGYHVLEVLEHRPAGPVSYENLKDFLRKYLQQTYPKRKYEAHVQELREKARIEINLD